MDNQTNAEIWPTLVDYAGIAEGAEHVDETQTRDWTVRAFLRFPTREAVARLGLKEVRKQYYIQAVQCMGKDSRRADQTSIIC